MSDDNPFNYPKIRTDGSAVSFKSGTVIIAGRRFERQDIVERSKAVGDMKQIDSTCGKCMGKIVILTAYTGPGLNTLTLKKICGKCNIFIVDEIDFSKVSQISRYNLRLEKERQFIMGKDIMEGSCSGIDWSKSDVVVVGEDMDVPVLVEAPKTVNPYSCVCEVSDDQKERIQSVAASYWNLHREIRSCCKDHRLTSVALTDLEKSFQAVRQGILFEGKTLER